MMNFTELAENAGLEEGEFRELMKVFIERSLLDLKRLQNSLDKGNLQGIVEAAHSIKGAAGNLYFEEVYQIAKDIEMKARENILNGISHSVSLLYEKIEKILRNSGNSDE
ncbi:MAG: Hpt domain-containing protein [Thermodesulfovibrionales bacterium]